jgi:hypothetical protein
LSNKGVNPECGHPIILTAEDTLSHAEEWIDVVTAVKQLGNQEWYSEMYSALLAALYTSTKVKVQPFLSNQVVDSEPGNWLFWKKADDNSSSFFAPDPNPKISSTAKST